MGNIFKHMKDVDVVKNIVDATFSKIEEVNEQMVDSQIGNVIRIEDLYDLIPYRSTVNVPSIAGIYKRECILWCVVRCDRVGDELELGLELSFRDAILLVLNDWTSMVTVDNALENMAYENDQMEEELNPMEM